MTYNDEATLIAAAKNGADDAMSALFAGYQPLLLGMATRYLQLADGAVEREDLLQEANIAFLQAIRTFDQGQAKVTFGLYAKICIRNRLVSKLRACPSRVPASAAQVVGAPSPADRLIDRERYADLLERIACLLSKREMDVFRLYLLGKSYTEISKSLGITEKSVDNALYRMKAKLKKAGISYR